MFVNNRHGSWTFVDKKFNKRRLVICNDRRRLMLNGWSDWNADSCRRDRDSMIGGVGRDWSFAGSSMILSGIMGVEDGLGRTEEVDRSLLREESRWCARAVFFSSIAYFSLLLVMLRLLLLSEASRV
jgi:hypothetical protein